MSNSLAIAATTATLQSILQQNVVLESDLSDTTVTILPLDKARGTNTNNQLNLFLYMVVRNAAFVNADMPPQVQPGELGISPLPINLYFLVTAFGRDDDATQPFGHELLGKAMSILYDHPVLSAADIQGATQSLLPDNDLANQIERIRITFHPLSIDELSKLWTGFAMQYRLSAAYEIAVLLIESTRAASAPLPVLTRGPQDSGVTSQADLQPPLPTLTSISPPNEPSARLNDIVTLSGFNLDGTAVQVEFLHPLWTDPVFLAPESGGTATSLAVQIPNQPAIWPAGFYTVAVVVTRPGETFSRTTNQLSLAVAPAITIAPSSSPAGTIVYTVTAAPDVWPTQSATLILGDNEFAPAAFSAPASSLTFSTSGLTPGSYWVRLRVDGVDSLLVNRSTTPPTFDPTQLVNVT